MAYTRDQLNKSGAPILMALLLDAVTNRSFVTYGQAAQEITARLRIGKVSPRHIGGVAGFLMDRIIAAYGEKIPPINALIVDTVHHIPGIGIEGYLDKFGGSLSSYAGKPVKEKQQIIRPMYHKVYSYESWGDVSRRVFRVNIIATNPPALGESDGKAKRAGLGGPSESIEHKILKNLVASLPKEFGAHDNVVLGIEEYPFKSLDEVDVCFLNNQRVVMVEVKSRISRENDLVRGVYQCVKYVALQKAEDRVLGKRRRVSCVLAVQRDVPSIVKREATRLGITVLQVDGQGRPV